MNKRDTILQELKSISTLVAGVSNNMPFEAPEAGYFESLPQLILLRIKTEGIEDVKDELELLSPFLGKIERKNPFTVPEGYFNQALAVPDHEITSEPRFPEILTSLKSVNPYTVPVHYFRDFAGIMLQKTQQVKPAKVIRMGTARKIFRYAAAAVTAGVIILAAILFMDKGESTANDLTAGIKQVTDMEMVRYLETADMLMIDAAYSSTSTDLQSDDIRQLLEDVSDETLQQYLTQYTDPKETLVN